MRSRLCRVAAGLAAVLAACARPTTGSPDTLTGPTTAFGAGTAWDKPSLVFGALEPVRMLGTAPPLQALEAAAWVVQGRGIIVRIDYRPRTTGTAPEPFLTLTIPAGAALVTPEGRALAPGDSVLISLRVFPGTMTVQLAPEGLHFGGDSGAELALSARYADTHGLALDRLAAWVSSGQDSRPTRLDSRVDPTLAQVIANIHCLSNYAVAY